MTGVDGANDGRQQRQQVQPPDNSDGETSPYDRKGDTAGTARTAAVLAPPVATELRDEQTDTGGTATTAAVLASPHGTEYNDCKGDAAGTASTAAVAPSLSGSLKRRIEINRARALEKKAAGIKTVASVPQPMEAACPAADHMPSSLLAAPPQQTSPPPPSQFACLTWDTADIS